MNIPYNYIIQLKQLPSVGVAPKDASDTGGKTKTEIDNIVSQRRADYKAAADDFKKNTNIVGELLTKYYDLAEATRIYDKDLTKLTDRQRTSVKTSAELQVGLNKLIGTKQNLGKQIIKASSESNVLEKRNRELNKTFGISTLQAAKLGQKYDDLATTFGTGGTQIRKYAQSLNSILPLQAQNISNALKTKEITFDQIAAANEAVRQASIDQVAVSDETKFLAESVAGARLDELNATQEVNKQLLETQTIFQQNLGLSGEIANSFILFSATAADGAVGAKDVAAQLSFGATAAAEEAGAVGITKTIMQEVAGLASDVALQFSQNPKFLGMAVLKAKALGTNMNEIYSIGKNLLNIESSVNNELEYQLLSGKRLIDVNGRSLTQKFREAALSGDANAQASTLNEIIESQGDTIANNFMARKKLAETLGIGEDKLARMVQQRELLQDMGPGAEKILEMKGTELADEIAKFRKLDEKDPARKAFEKLLVNNANTLSTEEMQLYYLEELATAELGEAIRLQGTNQFDVIRAARKGMAGDDEESVAAAKKMISETMNIIEDNMFGGGEKGGKQLLETLAIIGGADIAKNVGVSVGDNILKLIPVIGQTFSDGIKNVFGKELRISQVQMTTTGPITIGGANIDADGAKTGLKDGIVFHPRDKFMQVNDATMIAGTNEGGNQALAQAITGVQGGQTIDYNRMAMAIASAMSNVNIVAPVDIYAGSPGNNPVFQT